MLTGRQRLFASEVVWGFACALGFAAFPGRSDLWLAAATAGIGTTRASANTNAVRTVREIIRPPPVRRSATVHRQSNAAAAPCADPSSTWRSRPPRIPPTAALAHGFVRLPGAG